jgi:hypothetical protein
MNKVGDGMLVRIENVDEREYILREMSRVLGAALRIADPAMWSPQTFSTTVFPVGGTGGGGGAVLNHTNSSSSTFECFFWVERQDHQKDDGDDLKEKRGSGKRTERENVASSSSSQRRRELKTPNPVSLERRHLAELKEDAGGLRHEYVVSEKSDGVRFWMFFYKHPLTREPCAVWVNRALEMYGVPVRADAQLFQGDGTLLDGELVTTTAPHVPLAEQGLLYLAYDLYIESGTCLLNQAFSVRWQRLVDIFGCASLIGGASAAGSFSLASFQKPCRCIPLEAGSSRQDCDSRNEEKGEKGPPLLCFAAKRFFTMSQLPECLDKWMPRLPYLTDGVIFQPVYRPPVFGRDQSLWKWKRHHTVDFLVQWTLLSSAFAFLFPSLQNQSSQQVQLRFYVEDEAHHLLYVQEDVCAMQNLAAFFSSEFNSNSSNSNNGNVNNNNRPLAQNVPPSFVAECGYVPAPASEKGRWVIEKVRTDKIAPNSVYTLERTLHTIAENITAADLLAS